MTTVTLNRADAESGKLPPVCVCCGEPATRYVETWFSYNPEGGSLSAPGTLWAAAHFKKAKIPLPVCIVHEQVFVWQATYGQWGCVLYFVLSMLAFCLLWKLDPFAFEQRGPYLLAILTLGGIGWVILLYRKRRNSLRAAEISESTITILGVCREFADAALARRNLPT
jgi:hypothetical protein